MSHISESLVIQKQDKLIGLVYPDWDLAEKESLTEQDLQLIMSAHLETLNRQIPNYCKLNEIILRKEAFEKTPKQSIKRYLYQESD